MICTLVALVYADYYELLGVAKDASTRDIRKAFKKLALIHHPDKNSKDPDAHQKFVKINSAFEVLKDDDLRKKYDQFGEEGLKDQNKGGQYESWKFYKQEFGLYDDDSQIETLTNSQFFNEVLPTDELYFVDFYSPGCSHCHDLAPHWRKLGFSFDGIVRIAAVNCQDNWNICQRMNIQSYPTLLFFGKKDSYNQYNGPKDLSQLEDFVYSQLPTITPLDNFQNAMGTLTDSNRVIVVCMPWVTDCPSDQQLRLFQVALTAGIQLTWIDCTHHRDDCSEHWDKPQIVFYSHDGPVSGTVIYPNKEEIEWDENTFKLNTLASRAIALLKLPLQLDQNLYEKYVQNRRRHQAFNVMIYFNSYNKESENANQEIRKLGTVKSIIIRSVNCDNSGSLCANQGVHKTPSILFFKKEGHETFHGDWKASVINAWVQEANQDSIISLSDSNFDAEIAGPGPWFVDFYAPWCPPCKAMLPALRATARRFSTTLRVATVDCTLEAKLCQRMSVPSYPYPLLFNSSARYEGDKFSGDTSSADALIQYVENYLDPVVTSLNAESFADALASKDFWLIDFYAGPWCGPCTQLTPQFHAAGRSLKGSVIKVGTLHCDNFRDVCSSHGITGYPTIRLYTSPKKNKPRPFKIFQGNRMAAFIAEFALQVLPQKVVHVPGRRFNFEVEQTGQAWAVVFGAPWCGPCNAFNPVFNMIAQKLSHLPIKFGKVDCQADQSLCHNFQIPAYPFVKFFVNGQSFNLPNPNQDSNVLFTWISETHAKNVRRDEL